jgi:hypothetical protein
VVVPEQQRGFTASFEIVAEANPPVLGGKRRLIHHGSRRTLRPLSWDHAEAKVFGDPAVSVDEATRAEQPDRWLHL